jgi:hypothetical protein
VIVKQILKKRPANHYLHTLAATTIHTHTHARARAHTHTHTHWRWQQRPYARAHTHTHTHTHTQALAATTKVVGMKAEMVEEQLQLKEFRKDLEQRQKGASTSNVGKKD